MKTILWIALLCISPVALLAPAPATGQRAEMKKLDWLVGHWKGTGWIQMGPQGRKEFTQTETIRSKLDGLVLVIEGQGKSKEEHPESMGARRLRECLWPRRAADNQGPP